MIVETLTGRRRHRVQLVGWLRKRAILVLEVEVHRKGYYVDFMGGVDRIDCTGWRDARVEDLEREADHG